MSDALVRDARGSHLIHTVVPVFLDKEPLSIRKVVRLFQHLAYAVLHAILIQHHRGRPYHLARLLVGLVVGKMNAPHFFDGENGRTNIHDVVGFLVFFVLDNID
jgi:hypothetical protein